MIEGLDDVTNGGCVRCVFCVVEGGDVEEERAGHGACLNLSLRGRGGGSTSCPDSDGGALLGRGLAWPQTQSHCTVSKAGQRELIKSDDMADSQLIGWRMGK